MSAGIEAAKALFSAGTKKTLTSLGRGAATGAAIGVGSNFVLNQMQGNTGGYGRAAMLGAIAGAGYRGYKMGMPALNSAYREMKGMYSQGGATALGSALSSLGEELATTTQKSNKMVNLKSLKNRMRKYGRMINRTLRSNASVVGNMYGR